MARSTDQQFVWDDEEGPGKAQERVQETLQEQVKKDLAVAEERNRRVQKARRLRIGISLPFWSAAALLWARVLVDALAGPKLVAEQALFARTTDLLLAPLAGYLPVVHFNSFSSLEPGFLIGIGLVIGVHRFVVATLRALT